MSYLVNYLLILINMCQNSSRAVLRFPYTMESDGADGGSEDPPMLKLTLVSACLLFAGACGGSTGPGPTPPNPPSTTTTTIPPTSACSGSTVNLGSMSASVDGVPWTGCVTTASNQGSSAGLRIQAFDFSKQPLTSLQIAVAGLTGPATVSAPGFAGFSFTILGATSLSWALDTSHRNGTGSVTVATLTSTGATGTFFFTASADTENTPAATGTKTVTNGVFNVTF